MISTYVVGTSEFKTRAQAVKRAQEYANDSGRPVTVAIERRKSDRGTKVRGRVLGFSASSILPTKYFEVKPRASNPRKVKLPSKWTNAKVRVDAKGRVQIGLAKNPFLGKGGTLAKGVRSVKAAAKKVARKVKRKR